MHDRRDTVTDAPGLATWLVSAVVPRADREAIVGDLLEAFADRADTGPQAARRWFWGQALSFFFIFCLNGLLPQRRSTKIATARSTVPGPGRAATQEKR